MAIPALGIDLPVIASPPNEQFPMCNTAEYLILDKPLGYSGLPRIHTFMPTGKVPMRHPPGFR